VEIGHLIVGATLMAMTGCAELNASQHGALEGRQQANDIAKLFDGGPACFRGAGPNLVAGDGRDRGGINAFGVLLRLTHVGFERLRSRTLPAAEPPTWHHVGVDARR
jgi:hypothetical protein